MFDEITATLGGRAAEQVIFGEISTGALNDLEKATKQAYAMVVYYGLSKKIGNISYFDSTGQQEYSFNKPFSEKTNEIIDSEIKLIVEEAYQRAIKILTDNKEGLMKLAAKLLDKEVIFGEDLEQIFGKRPWGNAMDIMQAEEEIVNKREQDKKKKSKKTAQIASSKEKTAETKSIPSEEKEDDKKSKKDNTSGNDIKSVK
jgi:cell division protease FtsH